MLPGGVVANLVAPPLQRAWAKRFPSARTVVSLRQGRCACGILGRLHADSQEGERQLRARYRQAGVGRAQVIAALERHRLSPRDVPATNRSTLTLADFVAEHARNAGPSLYCLDFSAESERMPPWPASVANAITAADVRANPGTWLPEQTPVLVTA